MLEIILLCAVGCLFFMIASVRFRMQLAKQEEDMANLRATRRQQARDRELAIEEFLDLQEKWRLDHIQEHFEFHTIPVKKEDDMSDADVHASAAAGSNKNDKMEDSNLKTSDDRDKTIVTLSSSSYDETDDDEEQQQKQQQRKERSDTATTASSDATEFSIQMESDTNTNDSTSHSDGNDANKNTTPGIFSSWLNTLYRLPHQSSKDEDDDDCCCICLEGYKPNDTVCKAKRSECQHLFHKECALQWFMGSINHNECPMCRITLLPNSLDFDDDLVCLRVPSSSPSQQQHQQQESLELPLGGQEASSSAQH